MNQSLVYFVALQMHENIAPNYLTVCGEDTSPTLKVETTKSNNSTATPYSEQSLCLFYLKRKESLQKVPSTTRASADTTHTVCMASRG